MWGDKLDSRDEAFCVDETVCRSYHDRGALVCIQLESRGDIIGVTSAALNRNRAHRLD